MIKSKRDFEFSEVEFAKLTDQVSRFVSRHISDLEGPWLDTQDKTSNLPLLEFQENPLPGGLDLILSYFDQCLKTSMPANHGGYMAYIPGGGIPSAALAGFLAASVNRHTGVAHQAPDLVKLEEQVIRWLCKEFDYSKSAYGILTSGGSIANLTALICARVKYFDDLGDYSKARLYVSDQVHHSVRKSARLSGIPGQNCVSIQTDDQFKMSMCALKKQIISDLEHNLKPFCVVASAGTTNTGAIDNLNQINEICRTFNLWFHIDAAYGGGFQLCERGKDILQGISKADSITVDPHKGMFLPYGMGALLVSEPDWLRKSNHYTADYLAKDNGLSPADLSVELSRDFRGFRLWLPLILHGTQAFREALTEKLELTDWLYQKLSKLDLEMLSKPELSIIVFRPNQGGEDRCYQLCEAVNNLGRVYLAPTRLRGQMALRICLLSFRTHFEQVQACLEDIQNSLYELE